MSDKDVLRTSWGHARWECSLKGRVGHEVIIPDVLVIWVRVRVGFRLGFALRAGSRVKVRVRFRVLGDR